MGRAAQARAGQSKAGGGRAAQGRDRAERERARDAGEGQGRAGESRACKARVGQHRAEAGPSKSWDAGQDRTGQWQGQSMRGCAEKRQENTWQGQGRAWEVRACWARDDQLQAEHRKGCTPQLQGSIAGLQMTCELVRPCKGGEARGGGGCLTRQSRASRVWDRVGSPLGLLSTCQVSMPADSARPSMFIV